jgi:tRNA threonylcarbamoyladenosine biosynthesis protein TsaE
MLRFFLSCSKWKEKLVAFFPKGYNRYEFNFSRWSIRGEGMKRTMSFSDRETEEWGRRLGQAIKPGSFIALEGDLGAGKTAFTRGIARGLDIDDPITSPTYTLVQEYEGRLPLYHFDVYRLDDSDEILEIGAEEYFYGEGVTVVEWPQRVEDYLPLERLIVRIEKGTNDNERELVWLPQGQQYVELVKEIFG